MSTTAAKQNQRNRRATEDKLIAAAVGEFAEKGYENATTRVIAKRASCSEALIQRYFDGKEGLLLAVLKQNESNFGMDFARPLCLSIAIEAREMLTSAIAQLASRSETMRIVLSRVLLDSSFRSDFNRISIRWQIRIGLEARLARYALAGMLDPTLDLGVTTEYLMSLMFQLGLVHPEFHGTSVREIDRMVEPFAILFARSVAPTPSPQGV